MNDEQFLSSARSYSLYDFLVAVGVHEPDTDFAEARRARYDRMGSRYSPPSREQVERLLDDPMNSYLDDEILGYQGIDLDLLERALTSEHDFIRHETLKNSSLPRETIEKYLASSDEEDVNAVAHNAALTEGDLRSLMFHPSDKVRCTVASWQEFPPDLLPRMARDTSRHVRYVVAGHAQTPLETLAQLAEDSFVHPNLAWNANTPVDVLERLDTSMEMVATNLTHNASTPPELLARLAGHEEEGVRAGVAGRSDTPAEVLHRLAQDPSIVVRHSVGVNPATSPRTLLDLPLALVSLSCLVPHWDQLDREAFLALVPTWGGTLRELLEAISLTGSSATRDVLVTLCS